MIFINLHFFNLLYYYVYSWIDYSHIFAPGQTLLFLSIYMLGAWVSIHCKQFLNKKSLWVGSLITLILIQILNNILFAAGSKTVYTFMPISTDVGKDITQPLVVLTAVLIFIIFYNIKIKYNFFINFLGKISLLIYLFHALFLVITLKYIMPHFFNSNDSVLALLTWFGFTFLFSFTFSTLVVYPVNYLIDKTYLVLIYCKNKLLTICNNKIESFKNKKNEKNQLKINE